MKEKLTIKSFIPIAICVVVMLLGVFVGNAQTASNEVVLNQAKTTVENLKGQISVKQAEKEAERDVAIEVASGIDMLRVDRDKMLAQEVLEQACTWSNSQQYNAARETIIEEYSIPSDSGFLTVFLPEISGSMIDDRGFNVELVDMKMNVTNISGSRYTYFVEVDLRTFVDSTSAEMEAIFIFTTDNSGNIYDIDGMLAA